MNWIMNGNSSIFFSLYILCKIVTEFSNVLFSQFQKEFCISFFHVFPFQKTWQQDLVLQVRNPPCTSCNLAHRSASLFLCSCFPHVWFCQCEMLKPQWHTIKTGRECYLITLSFFTFVYFAFGFTFFTINFSVAAQSIRYWISRSSARLG